MTNPAQMVVNTALQNTEPVNILDVITIYYYLHALFDDVCFVL